MTPSQKLLFFVTEDWFFCSHFLDRAVAAKRAGYDVSVVTRVRNHGTTITSEGLRLIPLELKRRGLNPWNELQVIARLVSIFRIERPDIVHNVAVKPIMYGTFAARVARVTAVVNAPVGMGYIFSSVQWKARFLRPLVMIGYRFFMNPANSHVIFENPDDLRMLVDMKIVDIKHSTLIRGAGVDEKRYLPTPEKPGVPIVVLAARMLWDKGVQEFVDAARKLKKLNIAARFVLAGDCDPDNLASVPRPQLEEWNRSGIIEWTGWRDDICDVFASAHIVCLPSYREGLPKVLIEAAACGRPIVTTDVPGCREVVRHGVNGLLVPAGESFALADALHQLIVNPVLRQQMGTRSREIAVRDFSAEKVCSETIAMYRELFPR